MNFIIIGDKFQKRMKSKGCVGLIKQYNKTIIQQQYYAIKKRFSDAHISYVYGFDDKRFVSYIEKNTYLKNSIDLVYNQDFYKYNDAYSLSVGIDNQKTTQGYFILFGYNPINVKTFDGFLPSTNSQIFINKKKKNELGCVINNNRIEHISYDLDNYLSEIYYISPLDSQLILSIMSNKANYNCFIFELFNKLIDRNRIITPFIKNIS